jgi:spoIIIJ-associated protein
MYDTKQEPNEFVGESRSEAVAKASRFFGVEESELTVKEPAPGEIFGLGARAVVVAHPKDMKPRPRSNDRDRGDRGDRGRGGRDRERGGRDRGGRGGGGNREGGRDSGRRPDRDEAEAPAAAPAAAPAEAPAPASVSAAPVKPAGPSKGTAVGELSELGQYVLGMVEQMELGGFELREVEDGEFLVLELSGDAADALTAGDNRAVGAIQVLVNQAAMRSSESPKRVVLDCDGSEDEREPFLERQAGRAAKRALDTGRAIKLDPMNARDRRALHVAVRDIDDVVTMSVGTGRYRQVVIVPKGADEYDEALRLSEEAQSRD